MKILHITPYYEPDFHRGGVVRSTSILCRELVGLGHEVTVYTTRDALSPSKDPPGASCDLGGVRVVFFENWLGGFGFGLDMIRAARNIREFDVVHIAAFWQVFGLPAFLSARRASVPCVVSPRGSLVMVRKRTVGAAKYRLFYWILNRYVLKRASAVHFTAELERSDARALGLAVPSFCIPNAVPVEEFRFLPDRVAARKRLGITDERPLILFVGRLDRRKALDVLLKAFARVGGRGRNSVLVLAGPDFGEKGMLEDLSRALNIGGRVIFLGLVNAEERAEALAAADLVTLTSLAENFGNSGAEAMAAGIPVLVSDQCGVAEGIEEAEVGRVVPVDEDTMVSVLDEMLADGGALRDMGMRGPEFAKSSYGADKIARKTACAYGDLIAGTRSSDCRWADG